MRRLPAAIALRSLAPSRAVAPLLALLCSLACATPYDPYKVPAAELRQRVDTVALRPLMVRHDLVDVTRVRALIEPRAATLLREAGLRVVDAEEWERRWIATAELVGPLFDAGDGEVDEERHEIVVEAMEQELADEGVDAVVYLRLYAVEIEASGSSPDYCGRSGESVYWPGGISNGARVTFAYAICLEVALYDLEDTELYGIRNGIEWFETYAMQTHASKPVEERVSDLQRIEEALTAILGPLARIHAE